MIALIFRASVAEPWRIITAIHTRDPEKDLHMKDQAETAQEREKAFSKTTGQETFKIAIIILIFLIYMQCQEKQNVRQPVKPKC